MTLDSSIVAPTGDHPDVDDKSDRAAVNLLASLVGTWQGRGTVWLPTMESREHAEVVRVSARSPVSLDYWQRATDTVDGSTLHSGAGIWKVAGPGSIDISVALHGAGRGFGRDASR